MAMKTAAIYARVSSNKQKEEHTIASQAAALVEFARNHGYDVPREWIFEDEGFSGASLVRPGLERLRDLAAEGQVEAILVHSADRLSRKYAYQVLLIEEFARNGVEMVFIKAPQSATPEDQLLLQFQGHDSGVRAGADPGALPSRQVPSCAPRPSWRPERRAIRLSLCSQERRNGGLLSDHRGRSRGGAPGL
ncbi:MAG TPA: recombinase family protein [Hyphomicrobiaceae bacterium]|jgi:site-specific DNA recombinase|nr:recombinase family protein [Hyphomicrobiaceae bacterium]